MTNKAFSRRMLDSKKRTGSGTHSYKWKYHPTPWKVFMDTVTKPRETVLPRFGSKRFVLGIVALVVIIGGVALAQGPLFHNVIPNPAYHGEDPTTQIFRATDGGDFNTFLGSTTSTTVTLGSNATHTAVAMTKSGMADFGVASGKELTIQISYKFSAGSCCGGGVWGWYLTTNGTLPNQESGYDPQFDKSVVMLNQIYQISGGTWEYDLLLQHKAGEPVGNEHATGCSQTGAFFICDANTVDLNTRTININPILNYTGNDKNTACLASGTGSGCSSLTIQDHVLPPASSHATSTQTLPWFLLTNNALYLGFYSSKGVTFSPQFQIEGGGSTALSPWIASLNPAIQTVGPPSPLIDTGGFFGPIIRALISIGVFIAQNIINFLAFLAGVLFPVLATVFGILANALVGALNAIGNFFGLGNIGTTIQSFFTAIGSFLVNGVGAVLAQIGNAVSFFVNGTTAFVNIAGTYWAKITSFFTALGNLLSIIGTVFNDLLAMGAFSGNLALFMDWTWGMYKTYDEGTEGFHRWLDFNENVFLRVGKLAYFLSDHLFTIILRVKQLIVQWV